METITPTEFNKFVIKVNECMPSDINISRYDLMAYCVTLINGATALNTLALMQCNDRLDLVDGADDGSNPAVDALEAKFRDFTLKYLGLKLITSGDPRGAVFKLVVPDGLGDSFGDRSHLCVPCLDACFCL